MELFGNGGYGITFFVLLVVIVAALLYLLKKYCHSIIGALGSFTASLGILCFPLVRKMSFSDPALMCVIILYITGLIMLSLDPSFKKPG